MRNEVKELKKQVVDMYAMMLDMQQQMKNKDVFTEGKGSCSVKNEGVHCADDDVEVLRDDPSPSTVVKDHKNKVYLRIKYYIT